MNNSKKFDAEKYAKADMLSAQIPVVYCPGCHEIRGRAEMIEDKSCCVHCCEDN